MLRPSATRGIEFQPTGADGADASRVKRVPIVSASAEPFVFFAGQPAAERAADTRGTGVSSRHQARGLERPDCPRLDSCPAVAHTDLPEH
jgi:hypothetical protein